MPNNNKPSILDTVDTFMGCVPQGENRAILVYRRQHGGREYVRLRTWHRHGIIGQWYPDKRRRFIIPLDDAKALGEAIMQAAEGKSDKMPDWLARREKERDRRLGVLKSLNAPQEVLAKWTRRRRP